jgi:hypothetical protein
MKTSLLPTLAAVLLSGCVTVPIPPFGDRIGELGDLKISLSVQYLPRFSSEQKPDPALTHAQRQFQLSLRTQKDK